MVQEHISIVYYIENYKSQERRRNPILILIFFVYFILSLWFTRIMKHLIYIISEEVTHSKLLIIIQYYRGKLCFLLRCLFINANQFSGLLFERKKTVTAIVNRFSWLVDGRVDSWSLGLLSREV